MSSHLRLVVDNSARNTRREGAEDILGCLEGVSEDEVVELWRKCVKFTVGEVGDQYNQFMERHWRRFDNILAISDSSAKSQTHHRHANYFMMLVYLEVMNSKYGKILNQTEKVEIPNNGDLAPWVTYFAQAILRSESFEARNDTEVVSCRYFHGKLTRTIESA